MQTLLPIIARMYRDAPLSDSYATPAWRELAQDSVRRASYLRSVYTVIETDAPQPYRLASDMFRDLARGRLVVSSANSDHPLWTVRENVAFRICHDVLGHYAAHSASRPAGFDWEGELAAFSFHERVLDLGDIRRALFTEVAGQAAHALWYRSFGAQKTAFLGQSD